MEPLDPVDAPDKHITTSPDRLPTAGNWKENAVVASAEVGIPSTFSEP